MASALTVAVLGDTGRPARLQVTADAGPPKSKAGRRRVGLPPALVEMLASHREEQDRERAIAGSLWVETDRVLTNELGEAIKPNSDYHAWKALLKRAGVRDARLHDARHTAATVLLVLGVPERTVMGIMGWSSTGMQPATSTSATRSDAPSRSSSTA